MSGEEVKIKQLGIVLNQGEELCEECEGKKEIEVFVSRNEKVKLPCGKCGGTGKIDWIQKATGVHESDVFPEYNDSSSSISISSSYGFASSSGLPVFSSSGISNSRNVSTYPMYKSDLMEDSLCHVLPELRNMVKSIWVRTGYRFLKTIKSEIEKILKYFKMALTS